MSSIAKAKDSISETLSKLWEGFNAEQTEKQSQIQSEAARLDREIVILDAYEQHERRITEARAHCEKLMDVVQAAQQSDALIENLVEEMVKSTRPNQWNAAALSADTVKRTFTQISAAESTAKYASAIRQKLEERLVAVRIRERRTFIEQNLDVLKKHKVPFPAQD